MKRMDIAAVLVLVSILFAPISSTNALASFKDEFPIDGHRVSSASMESDAMQYMMKLYNDMMLRHNHDDNDRGSVSSRDNTYSFEGKGKKLSGIANVATFTFDVSALGNHETVLGAELRIPFSRGCPPHGLYGGGDCRLEGVLEGGCQYRSPAGISSTFRKHFTVSPNTVQSLDMTDLVNSWRGRGNSGCVTLMITEKGSGLRVHDKRKLTSSMMKTLLAPPHSTAIVVRTRDTSPEEEEGMFLLPSNMEQLYTHGMSKRQTAANLRTYNPPVKCSLVLHYVNFKRIGLDDRIIAPRGINVNFCSGRCTFPLATNNNRTIHAELQALLHLLDGQNVPGVCCSPMQYQSTVLLYYTRNRTLTLKRFNKISVRKCGCT